MKKENLRANIHWKLPKDHKHVDGSFTLPTDHLVYFPGRNDDCSVHVSDYARTSKFACPSELLLASVSSSQMLSYLRLCANHNIPVKEYHDQGEIVVTNNSRGEQEFSMILLRPLISFECAETSYLRASVVRFLNEALSQSLIAQSMHIQIKIDPRLEFSDTF